jgi:RND family efflux transporter MFP subunit
MTKLCSRLAGLSAGLGLIAIAGCAHKKADTDSAPAPPPVVQVEAAKFGLVERVLPITGTVSPLRNQEAAVTSTVSGVVDQLPVRIGQEVAKGELVAHLSTKTLTGQIDQAQATIRQNEIQVRQAQIGEIQQRASGEASIEQAASAVANAQATLASDKATLDGNEAALHNAREKLDRENVLFKEGLVAKKDVEDAQLALETAKAQVDAQRQTVDAQRQTVSGQVHALQAAKTTRLQDTIKRADVQVAQQQVANAEGALRTAESQRALYTLHSPLTGQVINVGANLGEAVDTSTKLVTIVNLDTVQLQLPIPAESVGTVHPGQHVTFTADNLPKKTLETTIQTVGKQVDPSTGSVPAYCIIVNPGHALQDDQTVKAQIVTDRAAGVVVPTTAVLTDPSSGAKTVDVVDKDGTLHVKNVTVGLEAGGQSEIKSGISAGDQVAVTGQYGVADGTKVKVSGQTQ